MPYLKDAVRSLLAVDYPNYEVVVQDGASTDGTLEFLQQFASLPNWSIVSMADDGIGQGFNRAVQRCRGDIVGSLDADNCLYPNAMRLAASGFDSHPGAAVVYGTCGMIDAQGDFVQTWIPPEFDLLGLADGSIVPPFASSFFSRSECGSELRFDETMSIVPDFDLWLRLSTKSIVKLDSQEPFVDVRIGEMSSTWTPNTYERQCALKVDALRRYVDGGGGDRLLQAWSDRCAAGLFLWGVESLGNIGASQAQIDAYFRKAYATDIRSDRFRYVVARAKPTIAAADVDFADRVFEAGSAYLRNLRFEEALTYFELLERSQVTRPGVDGFIAQARAEVARRDALLEQLQGELEQLQGEVNRRDGLLVSREQYFQSEITRRELMMAEREDELAQQIERIQAEVDRRDALLAELEQRLQGEIARRDLLLAARERHFQSEVERRDLLLTEMSTKKRKW